MIAHSGWPVGRQVEMEAITGLFDAPERLPCATMLWGEAGIGKTTLWLAGIEAAAQRGFRVMSARPSEAEARYSYCGLADLIGPDHGDILSRLPPVQGRALESILMLGEPTTAVDERAVAAAFLGTIRLLAADAPVCVAIDDIQWLDSASFVAVNFALDRLQAEPVAVLLAARGEQRQWLRRASYREPQREVEVKGLGIAAVYELLRSRLGAVFPRPTLVKIWRVSAGNPFVALELATALRCGGGTVEPGADLPMPSDVNALLQGRLAGLGTAAVAVAQAVAALGDPALPIVESAVGRRFQVGLFEALSAGILETEGERLRFTHPLLAAAIRARQTPHRKRLLHTRLARLVPSLEERARHLAFAAQAPDAQVASILEDAAREAHARGAIGAAGELAEHAMRLTPRTSEPAIPNKSTDVDDLLRRLLFAAGMHRRAGDTPHAAGLLRQGLELARPGIQRARVVADLAATMSPADSIPLYYQALAETDDDAFAAEVHLRLGRSRYWSEGFQSRLDHAELAVGAAQRADNPELRCRTLAAHLATRFYAGHGIELDTCLEAMALERTLPGWPLTEGPTALYGIQLLWSADNALAREIYHELYRLARLRKGTAAEAEALWQLGFICWRAGDWEVAERYLTESLDLHYQLGDFHPPLEFPVALVEAHRGDLEAARARASRGLARGQAEQIRIAESGHSFVLGFIEMSYGNAKAALVHLRRSYEVRNLFMLEPGQRVELGDFLEALIATGELDEAEEILITWQERADRLDRAWALAILARCRGLLCAARGDFDAAFACFDEALVQHARSADPFHHARTLLALGRTRRRAKQRASARSTLEEAISLFQRLGARVWTQRAQEELARIGGRQPSREALTETESRIVALVAQGHTNREIASVLFLAEHSVETALTRVYRKLGVRSRAQLTRHVNPNS